jgi:hypothetical protein
MRIALALTAAAATLLVTAPAQAATQIVDGTGILTGATGVNVGGSLYDVTFVDGTCGALFSGCDANSDFTFHTIADAYAASQALLDQVLLDGSMYYDSNYYLTFGCSVTASDCKIVIPYAVALDNLQNQGFNSSIAVNDPSTSADYTDGGFGLLSFDSSTFAGYTFARFTPSAAPVPEASSWAMMMLGFGGIGLTMRRRRRPALAQTA